MNRAYTDDVATPLNRDASTISNNSKRMWDNWGILQHLLRNPREIPEICSNHFGYEQKHQKEFEGFVDYCDISVL